MAKGQTLKPRAIGLLTGLTLMLVVISVVALLVGAFPVAPVEGLAALLRAAGLDMGRADGQIDTVMANIRLPRVAAGLMTGAALAAAGAVYQGLFRNPLVSPDILGVSAGAGLGAALGIYFSLPIMAIQGAAFTGGLMTVAAVYSLAGIVRGHEPALVLVLAGIVVGALAGACLSLLKLLADPYDQLPAITFWLLGSFSGVRAGDVNAALPAVAISFLPLILLRWRLNVMTLGDEEAASLGVHPRRLRLLLVASATLMTATVVSIAGVIGWVGLVIPHIARLIVGPNFAVLLPAAMLIGAGYMVLIDILARTISTIETPLGVLTAFVGAPVFVWLLARGRRAW